MKNKSLDKLKFNHCHKSLSLLKFYKFYGTDSYIYATLNEKVSCDALGNKKRIIGVIILSQ